MHDRPSEAVVGPRLTDTSEAAADGSLTAIQCTFRLHKRWILVTHFSRKAWSKDELQQRAFVNQAVCPNIASQGDLTL
jgi:hypothetical protein